VALVPPGDTSHVLGLAAAPLAAAGNSSPEEPDDGKRRRRWWWAAGAAVLAAAGLAAALLLISSPAEVTVPALIGQSETVAVHKLRVLGLSPGVRQAPSVIDPAGTILAQTPTVGTVVRKGSRVFVTVSTGPANVAVPSVVGKSQAQATRELRGRILVPVVQAQASRRVLAGDVISTSPSAGTVVLQGSSVTVLVSSGPAGNNNPTLVHVPNVEGSIRHAAEEEIAAAGLQTGTVSERGSSAQPGTVISQIPTPGASLAPGGAVDLVIAEPAHSASEVVVPNVVGKSEATAAGILGEAGLKPASSPRGVTNASEVGTVIEENPEAGQKLKRGTRVTIVIGTLETTATTTATATATEAAGGAHP
jgi:serine/threonine-protein kinase